MSDTPQKAVFDCVIYTQGLISPFGPAGRCLELARQGRLWIVASEYVYNEVRELPSKLKPALGVTSDRVDRLLAGLSHCSVFLADVPTAHEHPIDPDDSHYVNLALAAEAPLLVSRDRHLLTLADQRSDTGREFRNRFPQLRIIEPSTLLTELQEHLAP